MSDNDKLPTAPAEVACEDGLCSVARSFPVKKLGIAAADRAGALERSSGNKSGSDNIATTGGSSTPTRRPFLVDLLHGDVDLERFFKSE